MFKKKNESLEKRAQKHDKKAEKYQKKLSKRLKKVKIDNRARDLNGKLMQYLSKSMHTRQKIVKNTEIFAKALMVPVDKLPKDIVEFGEKAFWKSKASETAMWEMASIQMAILNDMQNQKNLRKAIR